MKSGTSKQQLADSKKRKALELVRKTKKRKSLRNWLDLPRDVMILIFLKLGVVEILFTVQKVCSSWRKLAKEPQLFSCIDMRNHRHVFDCFEEYDKMAREALNRCCGELVEFSMAYFGTDELMKIVIEKSGSLLKCIRLVSSDEVCDESLIEIAKQNPLLEELELSHCSFEAETIEAVGRSCLHLKSFRLNHIGVRISNYRIEDDSDSVDFNEEAFAIANSMPQLRSLHLFGNIMNNDGLQAILDKCPHLEYLDLRQCFTLDLKGDLLKKCIDRIRDLRLPNDSTHEYEYDATIGGEEGDIPDNDGCDSKLLLV